MDKIAKALQQLTEKERLNIKEVLRQLAEGMHVGLDIKKLKGREDIFRVRKGNLRIIYQKNNATIVILAVDHRSENTYKL